MSQNFYKFIDFVMEKHTQYVKRTHMMPNFLCLGCEDYDNLIKYLYELADFGSTRYYEYYDEEKLMGWKIKRYNKKKRHVGFR